ncbi:hypothetical protein C8R44DRAFT_872921 [Mycena epipterygia]|nr:hypothetical protein C8R44DRAFT_872921 [Mycena epipterygia]
MTQYGWQSGLARMDAKPLTKTNMTTEEMVPDTQNPLHDLRFWCLLPIQEDLTSASLSRSQRGAVLHLVTQGRQVGSAGHGDWIPQCVQSRPWHNAQMCGGVAAALPPQRAPTPCGPCAASLTCGWSGDTPIFTLENGVPSAGCCSSSALQVIFDIIDIYGLDPFALDVVGRPPCSTLQVLRVAQRARGVQRPAKAAFMAVMAAGGMPECMSTDVYDEAQAYAEGVIFI